MQNKKESVVILTFLLFITILPTISALDNYDDVLLVTNNLSSISMQIGEYFAEQRNITHWVNISLDPAYYGEVVQYDEDFTPKIRTPIENYIINNNLQDKLNYIITTKGVPLRHDKNKKR